MAGTPFTGNQSQDLRALAQNDYMIDGYFLEEGKRLNDIADWIEWLQEQCSDYRQQRDEAWYDVYKLEKELEDALTHKTGSTGTTKP